MINNLFKIVIGFLGVGLGLLVATVIRMLNFINLVEWQHLAINISISLLFGIIFFILSPKIIKKTKVAAHIIEFELQKVPAYDIALGSIGLIVGLIIAYLLSQPLAEIPYLGIVVSIVLYCFFGYLGIKIPTKRREDITNSIGNLANLKKT